MTGTTIPLAILGQLLFTMMGPIGLIPVFARATQGTEPAQRRRVALTAFAAACIALTLATSIGAAILERSPTTPGALAMAAGLVLTLVSLRNVLMSGQTPPAADATPSGGPPLAVAFRPIAFPTMVPPYGVGVLVLFAAEFPSLYHQAAILGVAFGIELLNLGAMLIAHRFMATIGAIPLLILGAVFSILQVALGIQIVVSGARMLG